ncbi:MAG TPA: hypothetical protein VF662_00930 [Allosphingosinicella sp.]|jgi:hypothetical protein
MAHYRLYHLKNGSFTHADDIEAEDDVLAVRQARPMLEGRAGEIWCGTRRVTTLDALAGGKADGAAAKKVRTAG